MVNLVDRDENDDKIVCVHTGDPNYEDYHSIGDLPEHERAELEWFFTEYKGQESDVRVEGFQDVDAARETLRACRKQYQEKFPDRAEVLGKSEEEAVQEHAREKSCNATPNEKPYRR
jgi:hypothetical protein